MQFYNGSHLDIIWDGRKEHINNWANGREFHTHCVTSSIAPEGCCYCEPTHNIISIGRGLNRQLGEVWDRPKLNPPARPFFPLELDHMREALTLKFI